MPKIQLNFQHPRGFVERVELENGEVWKLNGYCNRCGACCKTIINPMLLKEGEKQGCKHLFYEKVDKEELASCKIIWERPHFCILYPSDPHVKLPKECSYSWELISQPAFRLHKEEIEVLNNGW